VSFWTLCCRSFNCDLRIGLRASIMHVATHWIVVGAVVLAGIGILTGVTATRQKDSSGS